MASVAIIGGGVSGLAAACRLRLAGAEVTVFEAGPRLGGRAITLHHGPARFDPGAQFFRTETPIVEAVVRGELPAAGLLDIPGEVRPFGGDGVTGDGDPRQNAMPKWVYRQGIGELARLLWAAGRPTVHLGWAVTALERGGGGWIIAGAKGRTGTFDAVLLSATPRAASAILERSAFDARDATMAALANGNSRTIIAIALGFEEAGVGPPAYALVNIDRAHDISWLAFEDQKPGYVPAGHRVVMAHMASHWSLSRLHEPDRALVAEAEPAIRLLSGVVAPVRWSKVVRWPEALPDTLLDQAAFAAPESAGLFFAGDAFTGGRVHLALEDGLAAASRVVDYVACSR